ncbi:unnamed protein product [Lactuca saligna]|uniref:Uncharacterized protein n=1 Tax=Lactuca saligna TaxID=75948 RepID=A0AA36EQT9_LACSI|nr:unnamed protein product [Lactuca saligna]
MVMFGLLRIVSSLAEISTALEDVWPTVSSPRLATVVEVVVERRFQCSLPMVREAVGLTVGLLVAPCFIRVRWGVRCIAYGGFKVDEGGVKMVILMFERVAMVVIIGGGRRQSNGQTYRCHKRGNFSKLWNPLLPSFLDILRENPNTGQHFIIYFGI